MPRRKANLGRRTRHAEGSRRRLSNMTEEERASLRERNRLSGIRMRNEEPEERRAIRLENARLRARQSRSAAMALVRAQRNEREMKIQNDIKRKAIEDLSEGQSKIIMAGLQEADVQQKITCQDLENIRKSVYRARKLCIKNLDNPPSMDESDVFRESQTESRVTSLEAVEPDLHKQNDSIKNMIKHQTNDTLCVDTATEVLVKPEQLSPTLVLDQNLVQPPPDSNPAIATTLNSTNSAVNHRPEDPWTYHYCYMQFAYSQLCQHIPIVSRAILLQKLLDESMPPHFPKPMLHISTQPPASQLDLTTNQNTHTNDSNCNYMPLTVECPNVKQTTIKDELEISEETYEEKYTPYHQDDQSSEGSLHSTRQSSEYVSEKTFSIAERTNEKRPITRNDVLVYGEKFLQGLEYYNDTSITETQIRTLKAVIDSFKSNTMDTEEKRGPPT